MLTLEWVHEHLMVDRHALDDELAIHPQVLYEIGKQVAALSAQVKEAKRLVEEAEWREVAAIKREEPKLAAAQAEREAHSSDRYVKAWREYLKLNEALELWTEARSAWMSKGYALKDLGGLFASEYFAVDSIRKPQNMADVRQAMRERVGDFSTRRRTGD